jgi:hypothetical protein
MLHWICVSEWLLLNAKWVIIQLYHGENKLDIKEACMVLDQHAELEFNTEFNHISGVMVIMLASSASLLRALVRSN